MGNQDKAYTCLDIAYNTSLDSRSTWEYWGYYDAVFGLDQLWQYRHAKPDTNLVVAAESSHFVHVEEPELFATAVANYLNSKPRTITPS
jgi:pimeloyl-ACP methyl ester carboxylesterase